MTADLILQNTTNLDFSKSFKSVASGLNLGFGAEFRYEKYAIYKGEEASYQGYANEFDQAPGSQGFQVLVLLMLLMQAAPTKVPMLMQN